MPEPDAHENAKKESRLKIIESVTRVADDVRERMKKGLSGGATTEMAHPREAVMVLEMIAEGQSRKAIEKKTGIGFCAQIAMKARHEQTLAERRKVLAVEGFELAEGMRVLIKEKMEGMADDPVQLRATPLRDMAIGYGIFQDKAFCALGEHTGRVIVEHRMGPSIEDAQAAIAEMREELRNKSTEVVVKELVDSESVTVDVKG